jgi:hypothetical protein
MKGPKGIPVRYDEKGEAVYVCAYPGCETELLPGTVITSIMQQRRKKRSGADSALPRSGGVEHEKGGLTTGMVESGGSNTRKRQRPSTGV